MARICNPCLLSQGIFNPVFKSSELVIQLFYITVFTILGYQILSDTAVLLNGLKIQKLNRSGLKKISTSAVAYPNERRHSSISGLMG